MDELLYPDEDAKDEMECDADSSSESFGGGVNWVTGERVLMWLLLRKFRKKGANV